MHKPGCGCKSCQTRASSKIEKRQKFSLITVYDKDPDKKNSAYWGMGINKKRRRK